MNWFFALRALLRFEARQILRNKSRSGLIVLLVAIPVTVMVGGGTLFRNSQASPEDRKVRDLGRADLGVEFEGREKLRQFQDALEDGEEAATLMVSPVEFGTRGTVPVFSLFDSSGEAISPEGGLAEGMVRLKSGRWPVEEGEIVLSPGVAAPLRRTAGTIYSADEEWTVTGLAQVPEDLQQDFAFALRVRDNGRARYRLLIETERAPVLADRARLEGLDVVLRGELGPPDPFVTGVVYFIGGLAFFEAGLVLAAAFAVGLRRRRRETGLLLAGGANPGGITFGLLSSVALLSGLGSLLGLACGILIAHGVHPFLEGWAGRLVGDLRFASGDLFGACCFGLTASVIAAAYPAIRASREPVVQALSGRRPPLRTAGPWVRLGTFLLALGGLAMLLGVLRSGHESGPALLLGAILVVAGLCATSPWILEQTARFATPLPLALRLALRDAGRFRSRNAPAVTAIAAAMAFFVLLAAIVSSVEDMLIARGETGQAVKNPAGALLHLALAISAGTSLLVVLVATALSAVESGQDARALRSIGARPGLLRRCAASRGAYLAWLGALLAVPGGLLPAAALVYGSDSPLQFAWPWKELLVALTVLPVLAYLSIWMLSRSPENLSSLTPGKSS